MNCFHLPVAITSMIEDNHSNFHHLASRSDKVASGLLIRHCLREISPDNPDRGIAAAKVMQCALREIIQQERVRQSLAEYYGINYLLTSLTQAIQAYETRGRIDELMFVSMRIGRELASYPHQVSVGRIM